MTGVGPDRRRAAERRGRLAEWLAAISYLAQGYRVLALRFRRKPGEIDIVCLRRRTLVFVEVKARPDFDSAVESVRWRTRRRFEAAGRRFLAERANVGATRLSDCDLRFDIVAVSGWRLRRIEDAWREGE